MVQLGNVPFIYSPSTRLVLTAVTVKVWLVMISIRVFESSLALVRL